MLVNGLKSSCLLCQLKTSLPDADLCRHYIGRNVGRIKNKFKSVLREREGYLVCKFLLPRLRSEVSWFVISEHHSQGTPH